MEEKAVVQSRLGPLQILGILVLGLFALWGFGRLWKSVMDRSEPISPITYKEIESRVSRGTSLTEAQLAHQIAAFQGKKVRWSGVVEDVDASNIVFIDMDSLLYDVRFSLSPKEALRLSKGNHVTFVGVIDRIERFWLSVRVELRSVQVEAISE